MLQYETEPANSQGMNGAALGLGVTSLALGILGVLFNFIFCCGWIAALPCAGLGLVFGIAGLVVALVSKRGGLGLPIAGISTCVVGFVLAGLWVALLGYIGNEAEKQCQAEREEIAQALALSPVPYVVV